MAAKKPAVKEEIADIEIEQTPEEEIADIEIEHLDKYTFVDRNGKRFKLQAAWGTRGLYRFTSGE